MIRVIPLFAILLIVYNVMAFTMDINATLGSSLLQIGLISGALWTFTVEHLLLSLGVLTLYIEIFKSTRTGTASIIDHSLSMLVFVVFLVEFLVVKGCGTSAFMILGLMSLFDVIAGFTVTIVAARRDFGYPVNG